MTVPSAEPEAGSQVTAQMADRKKARDTGRLTMFPAKSIRKASPYVSGSSMPAWVRVSIGHPCCHGASLRKCSTVAESVRTVCHPGLAI